MKNKGVSLVLVLCLLVSCLAVPKISQAKTYKANTGKATTLKGKIKKVKYELNDPRFKKNQIAYILVLDKKIKIRDTTWNMTFKTKKIDIRTSNKKQLKKLKKKVGKKVKVKGVIVNDERGVAAYTGHFMENAKVL